MNIIDFHAHVLPNADHGCKSESELQAQLAFAGENGIDTIVSTSHFYPERHTVQEFMHRRERAVSTLMRYAEQAHISIRMGAEVKWCHHLEEMPGVEKLFIDGHLILLELPFGDISVPQVIDTCEALHTMGCDTLLAHVERYPVKVIRELEAPYIHRQVNAYSFSDPFLTLKMRQICGLGPISALGSDIHGTKDTYRHFSKLQKNKHFDFEGIMERSRSLLST